MKASLGIGEPQMSSRQLAPSPTLKSSLWRAALRRTTQNAGERSRDLMRLQRLGEQFTDAGVERVLCQDCAAIATQQYNRHVAPMTAHHACECRSGEPGHDLVGDDDVEPLARRLECGERDS